MEQRSCNTYEANWLDRNHLGFLNLVLYAFLPHSKRETHELASDNIVKLNEINSLWPRPWLYSRALLLFTVAFVMLYICWMMDDREEQSTLLPGMTIVGSLAIPLSMLLFFFETNKFRTIPLIDVMKYFFVGSCLSIGITFLLNYAIGFAPSERFYYNGHNYFTPSIMLNYGSVPLITDAIIEEFGKTLVIFFFLMQHRRRCYILQGMLIGAAVGAGFSVFETAGYALIDTANLLSSILARGLMAPVCHIAWGALLGGVTMMIVRQKKLSFWYLLHPLFSLLFIFIVALHSIWNFLIETSPTLNANVQLSVITWFLILLLMWLGLRQIAKIQETK
jgi:RsiW-degrading membrane proteinase PrsW (M82 family)